MRTAVAAAKMDIGYTHRRDLVAVGSRFAIWQIVSLRLATALRGTQQRNRAPIG